MARYIDADELTEILKHLEPKGYETSVLGRITLNIIDNVPSADVVEVKYGKWTLHSDGSGTCNLCGRTQKSVWDFDNVQNYCGKCGAIMNGGINDVKTI